MFVLFFFINISCEDKNKAWVPLSAVDTSHLVYKIDSVNNFYVIYSIREKINYKILSEKNPKAQGVKIKIGGRFNFDRMERISEGDTFRPGHGYCISVDDSTKICTEKGILAIDFVRNIDGLYFIKK